MLIGVAASSSAALIEDTKLNKEEAINFIVVNR